MKQFVSVSSQIAEGNPESIALRHGSAVLTYGKLNHQSDRLAAHLIALGVTPAAAVGICLERSFDWIVAALAIMRTGAAYVPMDMSWPEERLRYVAADSGITHFIAGRQTQSQLGIDTVGVDLDRDAALIANASPLGTAALVPDSLAYIIYTSGSSGYPKGVEITHNNLNHLVRWHKKAFDLSARDRASQLAGLSFDASVWETWPYLAVGASLSLADEMTRTSPELLQRWLVSEQITISFVPTALAVSLIDMEWPEDTAMRFLLTGGDKLLKRPRRDLPFTLVNNYGPTECTVVATSGPVEAGSSSVPTIGRPIDGARIYVLDVNGNPVADGEQGEICIGGGGVGRGYHNLPELTARSFVANPFSQHTTDRMYHSGDLGAILNDGQIEFGGRMDSQVKIRGQRVELDEISNALYRHPRMKFATVVAIPGDTGEKQLVAYVMPAENADFCSTELQEFLSQSLPAFMVPSMFVRLLALPLTLNGKIDRAALEPPSAGNLLPAMVSRASGSAVARVILGMVRDLLKTESVGVADDFFLIGGHSLVGTQLILRARAAFGVELTLRSLFEARTVERLAAMVENQLIAEVDAMSEEEAMRQVEASL